MSEPTPEPTKAEVEEALLTVAAYEGLGQEEFDTSDGDGYLMQPGVCEAAKVLARAVRGVREVRPAAKKCVSCLRLYSMDGRPISARCRRPIEHRGVVSPCDGEIVALTRRPRWAEGE